MITSQNIGKQNLIVAKSEGCTIAGGTLTITEDHGGAFFFIPINAVRIFLTYESAPIHCQYGTCNYDAVIKEVEQYGYNRIDYHNLNYGESNENGEYGWVINKHIGYFFISGKAGTKISNIYFINY